MECAPETSPTQQHGPARVAVVDDDPLSCAIAAHLVSLLGHRAMVESDPESAIARAVEGQFDLILLDLGMPMLDGFETLRRLRQRETLAGRPAVPVIAVTGYASEADRLQCLTSGFADHVAKPIQAEAFDAVIKRVLRGQFGVSELLRDSDLRSDADRLRATVRRLADVPKARGFSPTVMESFALRSQQLLESMREALERSDAEEMLRNARAMRSFADFLGVSRLAASCARIEQSMLAQQWGNAEQALQEIEHQSQAVLTVLFESAR